MSRRLVLATRNEHKVRELRQILAALVAELDLEVVGADEVDGAPDVPETEVTFLGNARLKATALAAATGLPAVADDSGLAVEVLGGAPGVFSARWSGTTAGAEAPRAVRDAANLQPVDRTALGFDEDVLSLGRVGARAFGDDFELVVGRAPGRWRAMSAAWAAILYAMQPCFTSSFLGRPRCSLGVT